MKNIFLAICLVLISFYHAYAFRPDTEIQNEGSRVSFNADWLFARFGAMPDGSIKTEPFELENPSVDDASWRRLDLPHDWGIEGPFRMDLQSTSGKLPWVGIGWYRKHFTVSELDKGKCIYIDFDGAMSHAKIWLNGQFLGEWPYGYTSFRFEMTPYIRFNKENILAVRLDNPPNSSRWYPGSGIYRNVWLAKTDPVHIAHWGVFVTTPIVTKERSTVRIKTEIENRSCVSAGITINYEICELGKKEIAASLMKVKINIPADSIRLYETDIDIPFPSLWNIEHPNLYFLKITLRQKDRIIETSETIFGIRKSEFTADNGFILNGRRVAIKGVCNHHDLGILGTAVNIKALERQINILKEMGCNAIRTSHNPPAPELLDICDKMGMLVLDEAFDCWKREKFSNDYSKLFEQWHKKDIKALVRRDRNHPCVVLWSSGNEVWEQNDIELSKYLRSLFLAEDSTRPVTVGCNGEESGFNGFQNSLDVFGFNYKTHHYKKFHELYPSKPYIGTETASCVSTIGEYFFPVSEDKSQGFFNNQVSSYDLYAPPWAYPPDVEFEAQDKNASIAGEFVWTGFDYLGEPTPFGDDSMASRSSYFGIVDLCGFKKDRFYIYQARWRPDLPMAHILPHWNWPERAGLATPVHVYTSGDEAELFLNDRSLGRKTKEQFKYRLRWDDVKYAAGELKVIAYRDGKKWAEDVMRTSGEGSQIKLTAESKKSKADGKDLTFITAKIVDKNGVMVPVADNLIQFTVDGPGTIAAVGNGDPTDHRSFQSDRYKAFHGQCLLIIKSVKGKRGSIQITAKSERLKIGTLMIVTY
jgi:beta-galactosidase